MTRLRALTTSDFEGGAGLDDFARGPSLAARLQELYDIADRPSARMLSIGPVAAKGTTDVHALIDTVAVVETESGFTNPDVPRNLRVTKAASWDGGTVTVYGTNQFDEVISEVFPALVAGLEVGTKIFKTVTASKHSIALAGGNGYSIGTGDKLGVPYPLADDVGVGYVLAVPEVVTVDVDDAAVTFTTVPAATTFVAQLNIAPPT